MDEPATEGRTSGAGRPPGYFDLLDAFAQPGCAVCRLALSASERYLDTWAYETFTDGGNRDALVRQGGFCTLHTWALAQRGAAFALAVAYRSILGDRLVALAARGRGSEGHRAARTSWWHRLVGHQSHRRQDVTHADARAAGRWRTCLACRARDDTTQRDSAAFVHSATDATFLDAFSHSSGLCLIHWSTVCAACETQLPAPVVRALAERQQACWAHAVGELDEMIRKHDYRFRDEPSGEEMRSWQLAAELVAGRRGVW
jgi:hypothetical protein